MSRYQNARPVQHCSVVAGGGDDGRGGGQQSEAGEREVPGPPRRHGLLHTQHLSQNNQSNAIIFLCFIFIWPEFLYDWLQVPLTAERIRQLSAGAGARPRRRPVSANQSAQLISVPLCQCAVPARATTAGGRAGNILLYTGLSLLATGLVLTAVGLGDKVKQATASQLEFMNFSVKS